MTKNYIKTRGSSTIEGLIWLPLLGMIVWGGFALLKTQYYRLRCAVLTFESTRKALEGRPNFRFEVQINQNEGSVSGHGRCGTATDTVSLKRLANQKGNLLFSTILLTMTITLGSLGLTALQFAYQKEVQNQLRADQCVAEFALSLSEKLNQIEKLNDRIEKLRLTLAIPQPVPAITAAAKAALYASAGEQFLLSLGWKKDQANWLLKIGCTNDSSVPFPLPALPYQEQLPDSIGPKPMKLTMDRLNPSGGLKIHLRNKKRRSCAGVFWETEKRNWMQRWANNC